MKIKLRTDYNGCKYITAGKAYEARILLDRGDPLSRYGRLFEIVNDWGDKIPVCEFRSIHINDNDWEVIE